MELAEATERITTGDLATPIVVEGSGEIGQLADQTFFLLSHN